MTAGCLSCTVITLNTRIYAFGENKAPQLRLTFSRLPILVAFATRAQIIRTLIVGSSTRYGDYRETDQHIQSGENGQLVSLYRVIASL